MTIVEKEPALWPEDVFARTIVSGSTERWRAYHVRPRTEKVVARHLRKRQIPYFLPQTERRKRYQRRLVRSHLVLFPGYVFALVNDELESPIESKAIIRTLIIPDQRQIATELRDLHRMVQSGQPLTREERLQPGSPARIVRGPLAGLCGYVVSNKKGQRFVLHVQFLQQGVSIALEGTSIEAL